MNDILEVNVFSNLKNEFTKGIVLKVNGDIYNDKFDFEIFMEVESNLNITLYKLAEKNLIGVPVEILVNDFCIFNGIIQSAHLMQGDQKEILINLNCNHTNNFLFDMQNVNFNSKANEIKNISKAIINKTMDNFEYIQIISQFNKGVNLGDLISYDNKAYVAETIVYLWCHKKGFYQEIHAINNDLHKKRYLS